MTNKKYMQKLKLSWLIVSRPCPTVFAPSTVNNLLPILKEILMRSQPEDEKTLKFIENSKSKTMWFSRNEIWSIVC